MSETATAILEAKNLQVTRGGALLLDIPSFEIREGETLALIGPNGAGKTTLLQTLCYLVKPFKGALFFRGLRVDSDQSGFGYRRKLAMVFQEPLLLTTLPVKMVSTPTKEATNSSTGWFMTSPGAPIWRIFPRFITAI